MFGGFVNGLHDASLAVIDAEGEIVFASASERYARLKHCPILTPVLLDRLEACEQRIFYEDFTAYRDADRWLAPQVWAAIALRERRDFTRCWRYCQPQLLGDLATGRLDHHRSHAASSFFTRPWESFADTVILTMDGIGTDLWISNAIYVYDPQTREFALQHADDASIGILYTAISHHLGFGDFEEGSMMGLSSLGAPVHRDLVAEIFHDLHHGPAAGLHRRRGDEGVFAWVGEALARRLGPPNSWRRHDVAASAQAFLEEKVLEYGVRARRLGARLCFAGGIAQNVLANSRVTALFDAIWIVSDPTDGGAALGAAAWAWAHATGGHRVHWRDAYLGHDIARPVDARAVVDHLLAHRICGLANGRAEFGPRALGNRSLLGDVRYPIKDAVNVIKQRESFRPFGPVILEEEFDTWFEGPANGYMQFACRPKHAFPSVTHVDGTARAQTVPVGSRSTIRMILEEFHSRTGVPMLLNTSLNIKGQPMVNTWEDALDFERAHAVKVF
jgi:carbamoyltransferase